MLCVALKKFCRVGVNDVLSVFVYHHEEIVTRARNVVKSLKRCGVIFTPSIEHIGVIRLVYESYFPFSRAEPKDEYTFAIMLSSIAIASYHIAIDRMGCFCAYRVKFAFYHVDIAYIGRLALLAE